MSNIQKCSGCHGRKKVEGLGMIEKVCQLCEGIGFVKDEQKKEGVALAKEEQEVKRGRKKKG